MADYYYEDDSMDSMDSYEHSYRDERDERRFDRMQMRDNRRNVGHGGRNRRGIFEGRRERDFQDGGYRDMRGPDEREMWDSDDDTDFEHAYSDDGSSERNWQIDRDRFIRDRESSHRDRPRDRRDEIMQGRQQGRRRDRSPRDSRDRSPRVTRRRAGQAMDRDRPYGDRDDYDWTTYKTDNTTRVVMLTGLPASTEDVDIYPSLHPFHASVKDVRIMRNSGVGGECCGFGFVAFCHSNEAGKWMKKTKKSITVREEKVTLHYSKMFKQVGTRVRKDLGYMRWTTDEPSSNLVMWNIPKEVESTQIEEEIAETGAKLEVCRILVNKETGESRGFGFMDFGEKAKAVKWYNESKGILVLPGGTILTAYSSGTSKDKRKQWNCHKCGTENFKKRDFCFTCKLSREESELAEQHAEFISAGDGSDEVGINPCNTLVFRGLDALTTEETLNRGLQWTTGMFCKNIIIMRDPLTTVSMSYAFGEMSSISEAKKVLDFLTNSGTPLEVDGKQILVSFAKNTYNTVMATQVNSQLHPTAQVPGQAAQPAAQPAAQTAAQPLSETPAETTVSEKETTTDTEKVTSPAKSETSKKETKKKKTDSEKKTVAKEKKVNYLELTLTQVNGFYYDPKEDKYYSAKIVKKCPVKDCKLKKGKKWLTLQKHWMSCHYPTKRAYQCVRGKCRSSKKAYTTTTQFFKHLETHGDLRERDYEAELAKAKMKLVSNKNFIDPGSAMLPAPVLTDGPQIEIPETKCPVKKCPHSYTTLDNMKEHWAQYHSSNVTMYRCGVCDTIDRDKKLMTEHMDEKHSDMDTKLEKVVLESKQYIDPKNVVPFWSLYRSGSAENVDDGEDADIEEKLEPDFPLGKIPSVENDPEDLCEFITWTERYMHRLQAAYKDAVRDLQKNTQRQLDKK